MAAFNYIEITYKCPACNADSSILCQTHFCSSYDGDEFGRFHDRTYKLGERMFWWKISDPRYADWVESNPISDGKLIECCYSECLNCHSDLYAVINFENCTPIGVHEVGLEANWPSAY